MGETWRYRYPITSFVQQAMLRKIAAEGQSALVEDESILLIASTFWSATARGELQSWFRIDPERRIREALHVLTVIGAIRMAGIIRAHAADIVRTGSESQFSRIEELLLRSEDPLEELVARHAARTAPREDPETSQAGAWLP